MTGIVLAAGLAAAALGLAQSAPAPTSVPTAGGSAPAEAAAADSVPTSTPAPAQEALRPPEIIRTENFTMTLGSRMQVRFAQLNPEVGDSQGSFGIRRGRVSLGGSAYEHFRYAVQLELAGGSVRLIDANVQVPLAPMATLWAGQGKAHFGRQQLNSSGNLNFVDRTLVDGRFSAGRQVGAALLGQTGGRTFEYNVGIYNGTGINNANENGSYMLVGRAVLTPLGAYAPAESAFDYPSSPRVALGVSGLRTTNGTGPAEIEVTRLNVEGAFKVQGLNVTSELYREQADPAEGDQLDTTGWYAQAGYLLPNRRNELAVRYGVISPDLPGNQDVVETGVALSHYFSQHRAKIQADLRNVERKALDQSDVEFRVQLQLTL